MNQRTNIWAAVDWWTVLMFLVLALFGWVNIYGAGYNYEQTSIFSFANRAGKQFVWICTAMVLGMVVLLIDEKTYDMFGYWLYGAMVLLLLATPFLAHDIKGSMSWITLGPVSLQPAEFAKCFTAIAVAKYMGRFEYRLRDWHDLIVPGALVLVPMLIIMVWQRETGSALVFAAFLLTFYRQGMTGLVLLAGVLAAVLFVVVIRFSLLPAVILLTVLFAVVMWRVWRNRLQRVWVIVFFILYLGFAGACNFAFTHVLQPHQQIRIEVLLGMKDDPSGAGYNVNQARIAIGSGRFFGKGYLEGTQTKLKFVPEQDTDFIFCTVGEEWGFLGSAAVLLLYLVFILRIIYISERQRDVSARVYGYSVAGIFLVHLTINVGMVLGLLPVIGIPLPMFSYGGSSLWGFTLLLFILLRLDAARMNRLI